MKKWPGMILVALATIASPALAQSTTPITLTIPIAFANLDPSITSALIQCVLTPETPAEAQADKTLFNPGNPLAKNANVLIANGVNTQPNVVMSYALSTAQLATLVSYACTINDFLAAGTEKFPTDIPAAPGTFPRLLVVGPLTSTRTPATPKPQPITPGHPPT